MNNEKKGIQRVIEIPLEEVQSPLYDKNLPGCHGGKNPCIICGKEVKPGTGKMVQLLTNGNIVSSDQDFENSMGFHPVGSNCAKKLVIHFAF